MSAGSFESLTYLIRVVAIILGSAPLDERPRTYALEAASRERRRPHSQHGPGRGRLGARSTRAHRTRTHCARRRAAERPRAVAADYADVVGQQVATIPAPIALAHSGSGPLLPAAARALGARHQVWLAAWVPHREASFLEEVEAHAEEAFNPDWVGKDPLEDDAVAAHSSTTTATSERSSGPSPRAAGSCRSGLTASGSRWRRKSRPRTSSPSRTARFPRVAAADGARAPRASNRLRSRAGTARMSRSLIAWRRSSPI